MVNGGKTNSALEQRILEAYRNPQPRAALRLLGEIAEMVRSRPNQSLPMIPHRCRLSAIALVLLAPAEIAKLFSGPLTDMLEYPLADRLRARLIALSTVDRDALKRNIHQALMGNQTPMVAGQINRPGQWIEEYLASKTVLDEFIRLNARLQTLTVEDQMKVERLLGVYQMVAPGADADGREEEFLVKDADGEFRVLKSGRLVGMAANASVTAATPARPPIPPTLPAPPPVTVQLMPTPAVAPRRPIAAPSPAPAADFSFSREDDADISHHRTRLAHVAAANESQYAAVVLRLLSDFQLAFPSEQIRRRFHSIIESRLRDVRDLIETKSMLCRPTDQGGAGLPEPLAMDVLAQVEEDVLTMSHEPPPASAPAVPPPSKPAAQPVPIPPSAPQMTTTQPAPKLVVPPPPPTPPRPVPPPIRVVPVAASAVTVARPVVAHAAAGRPLVSDIRPPVKTLGPVEELGALTVEDYRRLGRNLSEANQKIIEKLDLLEEDSYARRAEGIAAWKHSAVYALYLAIGRESMERNLSVTDIIQRREQERRPYVTPQEFDAIADVNKGMNF